ncbi:multicopper oxidase [Aspergillus aculeatus ATCC 16872]|uniref:laccase n=1 Tax=Aspergillus aculeatus (strain ATCC 16872 / CBS 172.66 / WB 5094) TaxID=690307 RepID=A0A1L9WNE6_ASPA1|nr:multicopper oxidase [Aspergillus aculeatus ATCC 16872]OJJ97695.1 multicopper oxidase [Aspergillus aculeatus ATCC 16872]
MKAVLYTFLAYVTGWTGMQGLWETSDQAVFQTCENTPTSRHCWGEYSIDTNYYTTVPTTGHTVEVWLSVQEGICNQDGYNRPCMTFNGTMPGPLITANWGDELVIHVTNNLKSNGTSIHWHGVRQHNNVHNDGVPGVTQCPITPGESFTYRFQATQYGTTWYHSHFSLQYAEGLFGPLVIQGPATANYDEDLGTLFLQDWSHTPSYIDWTAKEKYGITKSQNNLLINGTNTFDCLSSDSADANCVGGGRKFEAVFEPGKKYRLRLINVAVDSQFQFSIDGHTLTVISTDFVPIDPYSTDNVLINVAQRYDVIVEANAPPGDYWLRAGWVKSCAGVANDHPDDSTGIVRYSTSSRVGESQSSPTSVSHVQPPAVCLDEPLHRLVPHLQLDVTNITGTTVEDINVRLTGASFFQWTINSSSFMLDWSRPTLMQIFDGETTFPSQSNVVKVEKKSPTETNEWAVLVIENKAVALLGAIAHPIHLHGHDFWILAQEGATWDGTTTSWETVNPPRRDTAILPARGHLVIAFQLDNPGAWLVHCHIAWHAGQGLALQFVENQGDIALQAAERSGFDETCDKWDYWWATAPYPQDDSGI